MKALDVVVALLRRVVVAVGYCTGRAWAPEEKEAILLLLLLLARIATMRWPPRHGPPC
jgi:hypothetical protein